MNSGSCRQISSSCNCPNGPAEGGAGGRSVSKEIGGSVRLPVSHLEWVTFKMASKVFIEETDKNF